MIVAFDLDGTLTDLTHRLHYIHGERKDWRGFFAACVDDSLIVPIARVAYEMMKLHDVEIWSGRSDEVRSVTEDWLKQYRLDGYLTLRMRKEGDHRPDDVVKGEWLDALPITRRPALAFDDRKRVVDMWRSRGVICCQVAPGDF